MRAAWRKALVLCLLLLPALAPAEGLVGRARDAFNGALQSSAGHIAGPGMALVLGLMILLPFTVVVPMSLLCLLVGAAFEPVTAWAVIMTGLLLNTAFSWSLARTVFGSRLERWFERRGGALASIRAGARRSPLKWSILARFIPVPFVSQPMVLASTGVGLGTTVLGTAIAMTPWGVAYVWAGRAGRQGSLKSLGSAAAVLVLVYGLAALLRRRAMADAGGQEQLLRPRNEARPVLTLYTVPGHELSDEARRELAGLRDRLGFEVDEQALGAGADPALNQAYEDHAPVALFDGHKIFSFKMDEHVLSVRLDEWRRRQGQA